MRRLRLTLGYHGTHYAGWATQPRKPTVQASVESALTGQLGHAVRTSVAGRTDAGVHADAQVVSFDTSSSMPVDGLADVLARSLPGDIWLVDAAEAAATFDARRSAKRRWYRYAIWHGHALPAAWHGRALAHSDTLDVAAMRQAARPLLGTHDFASLATRPLYGSTTRTVVAADWLQSGPLLTFEICANAFVQQMVRTIVGGLLYVGRGRWSADRFAASLETSDRRASGPVAPAHGLTLARIDY
jgi:tRNA pseudouridine38-40 synthase